MISLFGFIFAKLTHSSLLVLSDPWRQRRPAGCGLWGQPRGGPSGLRLHGYQEAIVHWRSSRWTQQHISNSFLSFPSVLTSSNHATHLSPCQIFSSQRASPPGAPTSAAWGTWPSTTAEWASAKLFWPVGRSASGPVLQHETPFHAIAIPNTALTKYVSKGAFCQA